MIAAEEIFAVLDSPAVLEEKRGDHGRRRPPGMEPIVFDHVGVEYPGRAVPALDGRAAPLAPGEFVALVGPSGAGKSTIANLLVRLIDPTAVRCGSGAGTCGRSTRTSGAGGWRGSPNVRVSLRRALPTTCGSRTAASDDAVRQALRQAGAEALVDGLADGSGPG